MRKLPLLVLVLSSACGLERPTNLPADGPFGWEDGFEVGAKVLRSGGLLVETTPEDVEWIEGCILIPDHSAEGCRTGVAYGVHEIYLTRRDLVSHSSLVHELLHAALETTLGDPDVDHSRPEWRRPSAGWDAQDEVSLWECGEVACL